MRFAFGNRPCHCFRPLPHASQRNTDVSVPLDNRNRRVQCAYGDYQPRIRLRGPGSWSPAVYRQYWSLTVAAAAAITYDFRVRHTQTCHPAAARRPLTLFFRLRTNIIIIIVFSLGFELI